MLDVWIGDCLLLLALPASTLFALQRMKPRLLPGKGINLQSSEVLQAEYEKRYLLKILIYRVVPFCLAIYFIFKLLLWPSDVVAGGPSPTWMLVTLVEVYLASMVASVIVRIRQERTFVIAHPEFEDSFLPVRARVIALIPWTLGFAALIGSNFVRESAIGFTLLAIAVIGFVVGAKLRQRQLTHSRYELAWDEELGTKIADVLEEFGFTPKKLVLIPSLVSNAYATPDGSVVVTSALRTIATPNEVAAIIAHELSHVRDKEGKKIVRLRAIAYGPTIVTCGFVIIYWTGMPFETILVPLVVFGAIAVSTLSTWWLCRRTQPMEFKCDADAAKIGLGRELASGLDKITRFLGQPSEWIGIDRYLLTHPSLKERAERVLEVARDIPQEQS